MNDDGLPTPCDAATVEHGVALLERRQPGAALTLLDALLANDPNCAKTLCARGTALRALGRLDESLISYEAALAIDVNYARAWFNRGLTRFEQGEHDGAFLDFERALAINDEPGMYYHRAQCYVCLGKHREAVDDFSACIARDAEEMPTFFHRGVAFARLGNAPAAIADFEQAIRLDASDVASYAWLAHQLVEQKEHERAARCLDTALALEPQSHEMLFRRGYALYHCRDYESAVRDMAAAIACGGGEAQYYFWRGCAWHELDDYEAAIADHSAVIDRDASFVDALVARGRAQLDAGEADRAIADLTQAICLNATDAKPYVYRAKGYRESGNDRTAMADLDRALQLDPKNQRAMEARSQLHAERGHFNLAEADLDALAEIREAIVQERTMTHRQLRTSLLLADHFNPLPAAELAITERQFPFRVRADLQRAVEELFDDEVRIAHFSGVKKEHAYEGVAFSDLLFPNAHSPALAVPTQYEEVDVGESEPIRCLKNALWLLEQDGVRYAVFLSAAKEHGRAVGMQFQVAAPRNEEGSQKTQEVFKHLEEAVRRSQSYRGKILSLEKEDYYSGMSSGIRVHKLRSVDRSQVVLPAATVELLDRNIIQFARQRARLAELGLSTKKGILFYGPPGTGKTHTIHYLAGAMQGHTTLLITAEQVGLLSEYMTLARLLQPSIVVIEDADLIARDRNSMESACEEVLLNKLLNEMDGLRAETDVFFILTTNRPEALEAALASRPGRIDEAIEFPLPDEDGRRKLVRLYSKGLTVPEDVVETAVKRTERVSASFIKELMRRAAQFQLERDGAGALECEDLDRALEELLFAGGSLNCRLLGMQREDA